MRGYNCYYSRLWQNKMYDNKNEACWAGLRGNDSKTNYRLGLEDHKFMTNPKHIYIRCYKQYDSPPNYPKLLSIINTMTTCVEYKFNGITYIKYKPITNCSFYNNLVFLNFIRMIWYKPSNLDHKLFFELLENYDGERDGLLFLLETINLSIPDFSGSYRWGSHSLVYKDIIPKTFDQLKAYTSDNSDNGYHMQYFLTSDSETLSKLKF